MLSKKSYTWKDKAIDQLAKLIMIVINATCLLLPQNTRLGLRAKIRDQLESKKLKRIGNQDVYLAVDNYLTFIRSISGKDKEVFEWIEKHGGADRVFWDIGANIGQMSICASPVYRAI